MIEIAKRIRDIFKGLYESESATVSSNYSFDDIMESNESRIDYLNYLFDKIKKEELSDECYKLLKENIDFLEEFFNGKYNTELTIPKRYFNDEEECLIIPNEEDLEYLFKLIQLNKTIFEYWYKNKKFVIKLPQNSLNQNMIRILEVEEYNLAHLLGLTDSEPQPDVNKNILKKYFMKCITNNEQYGNKISERLLNWILSEEGKQEIKRLNKITIDFVSEDKKIFPNNYDSDGNIKSKCREKFKVRFKTKTGLDFPIIKYSRYITKSINLLNFLNMSNVFQIILDYNAPIGKNNEKDIFIVNSPISLMSQEIKHYIYLNDKIMSIMVKYANNDKKLKEKIEEILKEIGININDKSIEDFINLIQTNKFVGELGISPNKTIVLEKLKNVISGYFNNNIHLIGFDTNFDEHEIRTEDFTTNYAHCDTSISLTAAELVGEYYDRGRPFFLDKIYDETGNGVLRISNPIEEIKYLEQMETLDPRNSKQAKNLELKLSKFNEKYKLYKNSLEKGKQR